MVIVPVLAGSRTGVPETSTVCMATGVPFPFLINSFWSGQIVVLSAAMPFNAPQFIDRDLVGIRDGRQRLAEVHNMHYGSIRRRGGSLHPEDIIGHIRRRIRVNRSIGFVIRGRSTLSEAYIQDENVRSIAVIRNTGANIGVIVPPPVQHDLLVGPI